jgi:hypothetical protein
MFRHTSHASHHMSHAESTGCVPVVEYDRNFWQGAYRNVFECSGAGSGAREAAVLPFAFVRDGWSNVDIVVTFPHFSFFLFLPPPPPPPCSRPCCLLPLNLRSCIPSAPQPRPKSSRHNPAPQPSFAAGANQIPALILTPLQGYDHFVTKLTSCVVDMMRV